MPKRKDPPTEIPDLEAAEQAPARASIAISPPLSPPPIIISPPPITIAPAAPANLQAIAEDGGVRLTWQDQSFNEEGFNIRRMGPADTDFQTIATVGPNITTYLDASVQPNTAYSYRVRAFAGDSGAGSNLAAITTPPLVAAPSNLRATAAEGRVDLAWQDNSNNEDGFKVKRKRPADLDFVDVATVGPNVTVYTDTSVQPGTTYTYRIRSFRASGGGGVSNDASATVPAPVTVAAPGNLQATAAQGRVDLAWRDNSNNESGFKIERKGPTDSDFREIGAVGANLTAYADTTVLPSTAYSYRVRSFIAGGPSAVSDRLMVTTPAIQLPAPRINSITPGLGPLPGGTPVTVKGESFVRNCTLRIGGEEARSVAFVDDKTLTATTPAQMAAGRKNARVVNPDGQFFVLENAFEYINPPMIQRVSPNALPAEQKPGDPPPLVSVGGAFFQQGAVVLFGQKPATVRRVSDDGMTIDVDLPAAAKGAVSVTVRNPDNQQAVLTNAFTYLGPNQAARPRINEITPLTVLDGALTPITLKGLNLKQAFDQGHVMVLGPGDDVAVIEMSEGRATTNPERREDTVTFKLRVTVKNGLRLGEQLALMVTSSLRPESAEDLLLEGNTVFLSVLSRTVPVPLGFTAKLTNGGQNLVLMAGRNMNAAKLEVWQGQTRLEMSDQYATEQYVVGTLNLNAASGAGLRLRLLDGARADAELGTYPLTLDTPAISPQAPSGNADLDPGVGRMELQPAGDRTLITSPQVTAVDVKTGAHLGSGMPKINSPHLRQGVGLQVATVNIERTLFEGAFLLPGFARPQEGVIQFTPLNVRVGKIFSLQALTLILAVEVKFVLQISVALVPVLDPFSDFLPLAPFNDFAADLPSPLNTFPGAFALRVSFAFGVALGFFVGLVQPKRPQDAAERIQLLIAAGLGVGVVDGRFVLEAGVAYSARIAGVRPLGGSDNGKILHLAASRPVIDDAGFRGFYFAADSGRACVPFEFDATLVKTFASGGAPEERSRLLAQLKVCVEINPNDNLTDFFIEPPELVLSVGTTEALIAKDEKGNRLDVSDRVKFDLDKTAPRIVTVMNQDATDDALVTADLAGETRVRALAATTGQFALRPSAGLIFEVDDFVSQKKPPRGGKTVPTTTLAKPKLEISPLRALVGSRFAADEIKDNRVTLTLTGVKGSVVGLPAVKVSGTGVSAEVKTFTKISDTLEAKADLTIAKDAAPGERQVTVELMVQLAGKKIQQVSEPAKFVVQVPARVVPLAFPPDLKNKEEKTGISILFELSDDPVTKLQGDIVDVHQCGAYRNLLYQLLDQDSQPITQPYVISEDLCIAATTRGTFKESKNQPIDPDLGDLEDLQSLTKPIRLGCPQPQDRRNLFQRLVVTIDDKLFLLTPVYKILKEVVGERKYKIDVLPVEEKDLPDIAKPSGAGPIIERFDPPTQELGGQVSITGRNLTCVKQVDIIGVNAGFEVKSPTLIVAVVPFELREGQSGSVKVTTAVTPAAEKGGFTVATEEDEKVELLFAPAMQNVTAGQPAVYTVALNRQNYTGPVSLAASGLPTGAAAMISPNPVTGNSATLTVSTPANLASQSTLMIRGTAASISIAPVSAGLTVMMPKAIASVSLSASPLATIIAGGAASCSIAIARTNYPNAITLRLQGLPRGASASFAPNPAPGVSSTLNVLTSAFTPAGVYLLTLGAGGAGITIAPVTIRLEVALRKAPFPRNPRGFPEAPVEPPVISGEAPEPVPGEAEIPRPGIAPRPTRGPGGDPDTGVR